MKNGRLVVGLFLDEIPQFFIQFSEDTDDILEELGAIIVIMGKEFHKLSYILLENVVIAIIDAIDLLQVLNESIDAFLEVLRLSL